MCDIAKRIGNDIRKQMIDETNIKPEDDIPLEKQSINTIRQETAKQIKKI